MVKYAAYAKSKDPRFKQENATPNWTYFILDQHISNHENQQAQHEFHLCVLLLLERSNLETVGESPESLF